MTNETLYINIDQNTEVRDTSVCLKDIAQLDCSNKSLENRIKALKFPGAVKEKPGRYVHSVMEVIALIHQDFPSVEINNIGEPEFIITLYKKKQFGAAIDWLKAALVCFLVFFGAAFSIMTFNNEVSITDLFGQIYEQFTGQTSDGFTILELSYSIGVGIGILFFFNHFAGKKLTADPTPLEVQMRIYEDDINKTLLEDNKRNPDKEKQN